MTDRKSLLWGAALLLPLLGYGYTWMSTHQMAQQGTDWEVPVMGYDPRDLLRGHYITFRYDWPGLTRDGEELGLGYLSALCIQGTAPQIRKVINPSAQAAESQSGMKPPLLPKCDANLLASPGDEGSGLERGRFYVPQAKAGDYEAKLADPKLQGVIKLRIRQDGVARPIGMSFRPRPAGSAAVQANGAAVAEAAGQAAAEAAEDAVK